MNHEVRLRFDYTKRLLNPPMLGPAAGNATAKRYPILLLALELSRQLPIDILLFSGDPDSSVEVKIWLKVEIMMMVTPTVAESTW